MYLVEQEHYVIMFFYKADRQINSEIVEEIENNMLHCMIHSQGLWLILAGFLLDGRTNTEATGSQMQMMVSP